MSATITKETVIEIIDYMKKKKHVPLLEKCKRLGISPKYYYGICKKFGLDGKLGTRVPRVKASKMLKAISEDDSDNEQCTQAPDALE